MCAALRVMGLTREPGFSKYHHLLNRTDWSLLAASKIVLNLILGVVGTEAPLVLFIDETLERRKGPKIKAKGYYRDAVRSSKKNGCYIVRSKMADIGRIVALSLFREIFCIALYDHPGTLKKKRSKGKTKA